MAYPVGRPKKAAPRHKAVEPIACPDCMAGLVDTTPPESGRLILECPDCGARFSIGDVTLAPLRGLPSEAQKRLVDVLAERKKTSDGY